MIKKFKKEYKKISQYGLPVGKWEPKDMSLSGRILTWDVTKSIKSAGLYKVTFFYTRGWKAAKICWAALFANGKEIDKDDHEGFSGRKKTNITYTLKLNKYSKRARYTIQAELAGANGTDSNGVVFIKKM